MKFRESKSSHGQPKSAQGPNFLLPTHLEYKIWKFSEDLVDISETVKRQH
jgi:hypothetical protein